MPIERQLLTLSQWLSPAYPVGAFAYSHGLEAAVAQGWVGDAEGLEAWLEDVLCHGAGQADARLLAAAHAAETRAALEEIDACARAFAASRERLLETERMGTAFARATGAVWGHDLDGLTYPVALGRAAALAGIGRRLTAVLYLQAMMTNLVSAGQRLLPVGQTAAQAMLARLSGLCPDVAERTGDGDPDRLVSSAFLGDIAAMKHETQYSRIFST